MNLKDIPLKNVIRKIREFSFEKQCLVSQLKRCQEDLDTKGYQKKKIEMGIKIKNIQMQEYTKQIVGKIERLTKIIEAKQIEINKLKFDWKTKRQDELIKKKINLYKNTRFDEPMRFLTNEVVTHKITVNRIDLYYQPYTDQKIMNLLLQYWKIANSPLRIQLQMCNVCLPREMSLKLFLRDNRERSLQIFLNIAQQEPNQQMNQILSKEINIMKDIINEYQYSKLLSQIQTGQIQTQQQFYKTKINLVNFDKNLQNFIDYEVTQDTLFIEILQAVIKKAKLDCLFSDIDMEDENKRAILNSERYKRISQLGYIPKELTLTYVPNFCYFKATSYLIQRYNGQNKQISIEQIVEKLNKGEAVQILTYNPQKHFIQAAEVKAVQSVQGILRFYRLEAIFNEEFFELSCCKETLFLNDQQKWIAAKNIKKGHAILGINKEKEIVPYRVTKLQVQQNHYGMQTQMSQQIYQVCYSISCPKFRNIILNNFIVHNKNQVKIQVHQIAEKLATIQMQVFRDARLKEVFGERRCQIIGNRLKNQATFGSYIYSHKTLVYVCQNQGMLNNLMISERNGCNVDYCSLSQADRYALYNKWRFDYLGLRNCNIIPLENLRTVPNKEYANHMIVDKRGNFQQFNYFQNIEPIFRHNEQDCYLSEKSFMEVEDELKRLRGIDEMSYCGIRHYTQSGPLTIHKQLNHFLYAQYGRKQIDEKRLKKQFQRIGWIYKSLNHLQNYQGNVYRGVQNVDLKAYLGLANGSPYETITLNTFTSTSIDQVIARNFSNSGGCLLTIKSKRGKCVSMYSSHPNQLQVIFPPFTQFMILDYNLSARPQTATLEQLVLPHISSNKILYWVDDKPQNNRFIIEKYLKPKEIQVIQVLSTRMMAVIIQKYFWMFNIMGKKVMVVTDMVRQEVGIVNNEAGVDLLHFMYNSSGLSNKAIVYTTNQFLVYMGLESLTKLKKGYWSIANEEQDLVKKIFEEFQIMV